MNTQKKAVEMKKWELELTDTYGGEANYSWVQKETIKLPVGSSTRRVVRAAKKWAGWSGYSGITNNMGDLISIKPHSICQILFAKQLN